MTEETAIVYIMESKLGNKVYIGSTIQSLANRIANHKCKYKIKDYCSSHILYDEYGIKNINVRILEIVPIALKRNREQYWILQHSTAVNKYKAYQTFEEYKEQQKAQHDKVRNDPEKWKRHLTHGKERIVCECGSKPMRKHLAIHKKSQKHINGMNTVQTTDASSA